MRLPARATAAPGRAAPRRRTTAAGRLIAAAALFTVALLTVALAGCTGSSDGAAGATTTSTRPADARSPSSQPARQPSPSAGARWYLSLGDSLAFGFQQARFSRLVRSNRYRPAAFPGYTVALARRLSAGGTPIRTVNYGCPGETTASYLTGGCAFHLLGARLHDEYRGSQRAAAAAFLRAHRGHVRLVTVSLGANDLNRVRARCRLDIGCYERALPAITSGSAARLARIVRALRAADPSVRVLTLLPYDPAAVDSVATVPLLAAFDRRLAHAAAAAGAVPVGTLAAFNAGGVGRICSLTLYCGPAHDGHPSDAGYAVLARLLASAAGAG